MKNYVEKFTGIKLLLFFIVCTSFYCSRPSENGASSDKSDTTAKKKFDNIEFSSPSRDETFTIGDEVNIELKISNPQTQPDSVQLFARNDKISVLVNGQQNFSWISNVDKVGRTSLRTVAFYGDSLTETTSVNVTFLSDIQPGMVEFQIVGEYPHDPEAFTQGLVFDNGYFFESTGHYGKSTVRKVDVKTGNVLKVHQLGQEFFGEGLAIYDSRLFQLTWKEQVGFIFDKENFTMLQKVYYDIKEGWGLTYNGKAFVLSDGTSKLYFMDPQYFTEISRLEIYDDKGMVPYLNELEYIDGKIFANIWGKEIIAVIDPLTGKVTHYLDVSEHVPSQRKKSGDMVLNGIAYNPGNGNLFITGKYWPVLYELEYSLVP